MSKKKNSPAAITARLDGVRSIAERIGGKIEVSEIELLVLCNFAKLGFWAVAGRGVGGRGDRCFDELSAAIKQEWAANGQDGMTRMFEACAALLDGEKLKKYVLV